MYKIKTKADYNYEEQEYEVNNLPSETVPDQSMSMSEIMRRFASGLPIAGAKVPIYNGEEDLPDLSRMDLAEQQEFMDQTKDEITDLKNRFAKEQNIRKQKEKEEQERKRKYEDQQIPFEELDDEEQKANKRKRNKQNPNSFE